MASTCYHFWLNVHMNLFRELTSNRQYISRALNVAERQNSGKKDPSSRGANIIQTSLHAIKNSQ